MMRWMPGVSFRMMAAWIMVPDTLDEDETELAAYGVLLTTVIAFFLAEMGDKIQIATIALAARYESMFAVVAAAPHSA